MINTVNFKLYQQVIKNYLKTAFRNLWKGRIFNSLNVIGLSVAIACCTLLFLAVHYEFSFDKFHKNLPNIYQLYRVAYRVDGVEKSTSMPGPLAEAVKSNYPEVAAITRLGNGGAQVRYKDKLINQNIHFVDPAFLSIFTFPVLKGNSSSPLAHLNDIVITEYAAKALFDKGENPVGKVVELAYQEKPQSFIVSAVVKDFPNNSSITFDILMRFENYPGYRESLDQWDNHNHTVIAQLKENVDQAAFEKRLLPFMHQHYKKEIRDIKKDGSKANGGEVLTLSLLPYADNHFNTEMNGLEGPSVSRTAVLSLLTIGIFILLIACINFINLSVARSFNRAREVGVRKTLGASKWQLLWQFWIETILLCLVALAIGLTIAGLLLSSFKTTLRTPISLAMLLQPVQLLAALGIFALITFIAGFYPAMLMLRFKTIQVLKGTVSAVKPGKIRNTLLVVQFTISTMLIVCTLITWQQTSFMRNQPLGYNKTEVLSIPVGNGVDGYNTLNLFRNVMANEPDVLSISGAYDNLGRGADGSSRTSVVTFDYKGHELRTNLQNIDFDFLKTLDIKLLDGRDFTRGYIADSNAVLVNEVMARQIDPKGQKVAGTFLPINGDKAPQQVIGVVKNYNFRSLHEQIAPLTLVMNKDFGINYVFVKVKPNNLVQAYHKISHKWHETFPTVEFKGTWLSENTEKQYRKEQRLSAIFISSAVIAIIISCIGLVAISVMIMVQRTKEIGIRKVLGSSVASIVMLLSRDFLKLVMLAATISFPIAWWLMSKWLDGYAYRISIHWWVFGLAGIISLGIAFITISFQSVKAAIANPVKSLRSE